MDPNHAHILEQLKAAARPSGGFNLQAYLGGAHPCLGVPVPERRRIARAWLAAHKGVDAATILELADSLIAGETHEEKTLGPMLVALNKPARRAVRPERVDRWLDYLAGWGEVDGLCQNTFPAEDLLADWPAWKALIERLARDPDINKRRAALVLLTHPAGKSDDLRFRDLAFQTIDRLKAEKPVILTKAVSWLLRCLAVRHPAAVTAYLDAHASELPAIAVRETRRKLQTGKK